ncbi:hypothetical protein KC340_g15344 [Hortaea werneckii]|nr:hypothetical protein KC342_g15685 [Hortaea werneckii]KAI7062810.1 hypothetical protein KC339_g16470 [Hortaea werneckii]KAI7223829.1 hypothetical protein KC365_g11018 [Hortaea werneckii]KAI7296586.1 hypothetical protein KC340_g15344 [Hortaea werneckii]KAI7373283.1 hypothetical protein KC328_g16711 [Hortaea werneckii]
MAPKKSRNDNAPKSFDPTHLSTPSLDSKTLRMSYKIARGEQGVLTFEPYKSILLPYWRFKTASIAEESSQTLWKAFQHYVKAGDFVGADMARKFIQMGMTRAKRYANHKGGKKYDRSERQVEKEGGSRTELDKSESHDGRDEKLKASDIFKEVWRGCFSHERFLELRSQFLYEQSGWNRLQKEAKQKAEQEPAATSDKVKGEVKSEED